MNTLVCATGVACCMVYTLYSRVMTPPSLLAVHSMVYDSATDLISFENDTLSFISRRVISETYDTG